MLETDYTRRPNAAEIKKWREWLRLVKRLEHENALTGLLELQYKREFEFARLHGITLAPIDPVLEKTEIIELAVARLQRWIGFVKEGRLGVRVVDGDLNIYAPPGTTADELAQFGWIIYLAGALVAVAVCAYVEVIRSHNVTLVKRLEEMRYDAHAKFCNDPNSAICRQWLSRAKKRDYLETDSIIEKTKDWISTAGENIQTGLGSGIALLIPIAAIWFLMKGKK